MNKSISYPNKILIIVNSAKTSGKINWKRIVFIVKREPKIYDPMSAPNG